MLSALFGLLSHDVGIDLGTPLVFPFAFSVLFIHGHEILFGRTRGQPRKNIVRGGSWSDLSRASRF